MHARASAMLLICCEITFLNIRAHILGRVYCMERNRKLNCHRPRCIYLLIDLIFHYNGTSLLRNKTIKKMFKIPRLSCKECTVPSLMLFNKLTRSVHQSETNLQLSYQNFGQVLAHMSKHHTNISTKFLKTK